MRTLFIGSVSLLLSCGVGGDDSVGGREGDASKSELLDCVAPGAPGNDKEIGKYCSKGGGQCNLFSYARFCTVDFAPDSPSFCTNSCSEDTDCGDGAVCRGKEEGGQKGCVPVVCLEKPKPTPPAPTPDAGTGEGSTVECESLLRCCADPAFPSQWLTVCQTSAEGSEGFCTFARKTYELAGDCAEQP